MDSGQQNITMNIKESKKYYNEMHCWDNMSNMELAEISTDGTEILAKASNFP